MKLTTLDYQPDFPEVDLTENNAAFLEIFLQNSSLVEASHPRAEQYQLLYRLAHIAVSQSKDSFTQDEHHAGFTQGFTFYEVISSLVAPKPVLIEDVSAIAATRGLNLALRSNKLTDYLTDAYDEFTAQQAVTAEVISTAADRYHPGLTHYALMGAAIERQLELEARDLNQNIVQ
jgi:hypothetical protein